MASIRGFQDYECVRRYLEHIYLYGFFSREDFNSITGGSAKDYDRVLPLLKDLYPEGEKSSLDGYEYKRIRRQYETSAENRMVNSYMLHSIGIQTHLLRYLKILSELRHQEQSLQMLDRAIWSVPTRLQGKHDAVDPKDDGSEEWKETYGNTRRRLEELLSHGYIEKRDGKKYALQRYTLTNEQLTQLYVYVCFAAEVTYPRVPGSFLRRTLEREHYRRGMEPLKTSPFLLRHNTSRNVFDEELVFQLLDAISEHQWIMIDDRQYLPVQLRPERRYGRWYVVLVEWYRDKLTPSIRQLSRVNRVDVLEKAEEDIWQQAKQAAETAYQYSLYSGRKAEAPTQVEVQMLFGDAKGLENQFIREIRMGTVTREADGTFYRVEINDPVELLPLLRSYSPWLKVLPGEHDLDEILRGSLSDLHAALEQQIWVQPQPRKSTKPEEKKNGHKRSHLKMLNHFQSRQMQLALELCARAEGFGAVSASEIRNIAVSKYGLQAWPELLEWLTAAHFLKKEGSRYLLDQRPAPMLPAGQMEQAYLRYILTMPEAELYLSEQTRQALRGEPPAWMEHIQRFEPNGMALPHNPGPEGFRLLLEAIQTRRYIHYCYRKKGSRDWQETQSLPWKLEYSAYDRRWWVILYHEGERRTIKAPLNHLRDLRLGGKSKAEEHEILAAMGQLREKEPVVLRITDGHNALQRCFLAFENQQIRESRRVVEDDQVYYRLTFDWFRFDEAEILRRLMHLGPCVALIGPELLREKLVKQVEQAMALNREPVELEE